MKSVRVYAPASIGNFGVGFDVLGAAIQPVDGYLWGDVVEVRSAAAATTEVLTDIDGQYAAGLPADWRCNLVSIGYGLFKKAMKKKQKNVKPLTMRLSKNLPLCSGLGSSSSSAVAALVALNLFHGRPFSPLDLLQMAGEAEGVFSGGVHLDNVAPSLLGGLQLIVPTASARESAVSVPFFPDWRLVVVHPDLLVPTAKARAILPKEVGLKQSVAYWQNLAAFLQALNAGDAGLARLTMKDLLIEPFRRKLVKGFASVKKAALAAGAMGCTLSGSGPSMFAVVEREKTGWKVLEAMEQAFKKAGVTCEGRLCTLDMLGAREM